jgi:APA family basic amino acid/polyamine antiporter
MAEHVMERPGGGLFVRQSTGLVREVSPLSTLIFNMAGQPTAALLASSIFWTMAVFPGANIYLALFLTFLVATSITVTFGLISTAIPRSGGDYVLVGRVIHPAVGIMSSFLWVGGVVVSIAFVAIAFVTQALAPSFAAVGLISGSSTLVDWGATLASNQGLQLVIGSVLIIVSSMLLAGGWKWTTRVLNTLWGFMIAGLALVAVVLVAQSSSDFVHSFNVVAQGVTGKPDTYNDIIAAAQKQGFSTSPPFSLDNTFAVWGAIMSLSIWTWLSVYIAGEVRQARKLTQTYVMTGASVIHLGLAAIFTALFFAHFGSQFFTAINEINGSADYPFASPPYYTFLTSLASNSAVISWLILITFAAVFPYWIIQNITCVTRPIFAWAFDGLVPMRLAQVNKRFHAPVAAIAVTAVLNIAALVWGIWGGSSFFGVLAEGALLALTPMLLISISAILLPYRLPDAWRGSAITAKVAGVPVLTIAGAVSTLACLIVYYLYLHYEGLGINPPRFFRDVAIVCGAALLLYFAAWYVRRSQGVDFARLTAEIPPE